MTIELLYDNKSATISALQFENYCIVNSGKSTPYYLIYLDPINLAIDTATLKSLQDITITSFTVTLETGSIYTFNVPAFLSTLVDTIVNDDQRTIVATFNYEN